MLEADSQLAVYLAHETQELLQIFESVRTATNTDLATSAAAGWCTGGGGGDGSSLSVHTIQDWLYCYQKCLGMLSIIDVFIPTTVLLHVVTMLFLLIYSYPSVSHL